MFKFLQQTLLIISFLCFNFNISATTIVPFQNLGEMAKGSEAVVFVKAVSNFEVADGDITRFRTQLRVIESVKGKLQTGDLFEIQHWHQLIDDLEREIWGDLKLEEGESYFLFLDYHSNGYWLPKMLSYAAFQEFVENGENVLVPFGLGAEVQVLKSGNGEPAEALKTYNRDALINELRAIINGEKTWNKKLVETNHDIHAFTFNHNRNTNPGHCTHVSSSPYARWDDMETTTLPIRYHSGGDAGCATVGTKIGDAITDMIDQYEGINISNAGTHSFVPSCSGEGANDNEFVTFCNNNLGGARNVVIQFDDPCSEITNLTGCSGTLAIGGLYWSSSTHVNCGITWRNAAYGYVVVNNGTGACQCGSSDYQIMITHEMSHCLNVGHISNANGAANMNPSCCNTIQALDVECLDYMYPPPALPVELVHFDGKLVHKAVQLSWETAVEIENDYFTIERSIDGKSFEKIGTVKGLNHSHESAFYHFEDKYPIQGKTYYRLSQTDYSGKKEIFQQIVAVQYSGSHKIALIPNLVRDNHAKLIYQSYYESNLQIEIYNTAGQAIKQLNHELIASENVIDIDLGLLNSGVYYVKTSQQGQSHTLRFIVLN